MNMFATEIRWWFTGAKLKATLFLFTCLICVRLNVTAGIPGLGQLVFDPNNYAQFAKKLGIDLDQFQQQYGKQIEELKEAVKANKIADVTQLITKDSLGRVIGISEQQLILLTAYTNNPNSAIISGNSPYVKKFTELMTKIDNSTNLNFIGKVVNPTLSPVEMTDAIRGTLLYAIATRMKAIEISQKFKAIITANRKSASSADTGGESQNLMLTDGERLEAIDRYTHELAVLHGSLLLYQSRSMNLIKAKINKQLDGKMQYFGSGKGNN
jgi:hypothetical protein